MFTMVIIISFLTDEFIIDRSPANKEEDLILVEYLSGLTLKEGEEEELLLPDEELPTGFRITYKRRCRRTLFSKDQDFTIIVSKEIACTFDGKNDENKVKIVCLEHLILYLSPLLFFSSLSSLFPIPILTFPYCFLVDIFFANSFSWMLSRPLTFYFPFLFILFLSVSFLSLNCLFCS